MNNKRKNSLNTKNIPPILMLVGGLIALIFCILREYTTVKMLLIVFVSMLAFSILGLVIKLIVDSFDMHIRYEDYFKNLDQNDIE